ncbi:hypothetical protein [Clostridium baratii]|uniref:Membrane protein n=1 Tax=Clostridium baratii TaxID=1561 RepID=A0A174VF96_9CLOT|nr:hypothetical protein [Clostridium baratii]CUQ30660.1 membrane protein [Clostridium baratii]
MNIINIILFLCIILISISVFYLLMLNKKISKLTCMKLEENLKRSSWGVKLYENIDKNLSRYGIKYMFNWITPATYILIKLAICLLFLVVLLIKTNILIAIISSICLYFVFDFILKLSNTMDNEEILLDLKRVYDTLRIQTKAGVFLTSSLSECYLVVTNKRLKTALLDLNNKITKERNVQTTIDEFNIKFDNKYIDTFCIVVKQSLQNGKTVQILNDLSIQIQDIEEALNLKREERIKMKLELFQFLIFIGMLAILIFGVITQLNSSMIGF